MMHNLWMIVAVIGLALLRYPARLAFNRRNEHGVEQFRSYDHMVRSRWLGRAIRLGGILALVLAVQHGCTTSPRHALPNGDAVSGKTGS